MKVRLHPEALADLRSIHQYIALKNRQRADSFVQELHEKIASLSRTAASFPLLAGFESAGFRRRAHGNYRILFRIVGEDVVEVTHVMQMSRDHQAILASWSK